MNNEKDDEFLNNVARVTPELDLEKYKGYLVRWADALETYGTPRDFVYSTVTMNQTFDIYGIPYTFKYVKSENNDKRRELMAKQKNYVPEMALERYDIKNIDFLGCFLCQNIVQAMDAKSAHDTSRDNAIILTQDCMLAPNRYPIHAGHSLYMTIDHDDMANRIKGYRDENEKILVYPIESGKTRGNIIGRSFLESMLSTCDEIGLVSIRNHPLNGMSIAVHDHFHIFPDQLSMYDNSGRIKATKEKSDYGCNIFLASDHPFDTLIISKENDTRSSMLDTTMPLLENLEKDNQVATLLYYRDCLFVSVLETAKAWTRPIPVGNAGISAEFISNVNPEYLSGLKDTQPMKGTVNWRKYLV